MHDPNDTVNGILGVCTASIIGAFVEEPVVVNTDRRNRPVIKTAMVVMRPAKGNGRERPVWRNYVTVTASGPAADNIMRNYAYGKRAFVSGEMRVLEDGVEVHAANLSWTDETAGL